MKKIICTGLSVALAGLMAGCAAPRYADVPAPTRFENTQQQRLQAAQHWQTIADHFAKQLAGDLKDRIGTRALYIPQPGGEQAFVEGFRELLITALVAQGVPVSTEAKNALTVDVRYSIYKFRPDRVASTYYYGDATMLAAGLWALGGVVAANIAPHHPGVSAGAKLLTVAAGIDGFSWITDEANGRGVYASGPVPRAEIILTASVSDGSRIVSRHSNLYYATDEDESLYWNKNTQAYSIKVTGDNCEGGKSCAR